MNRTVRVRLEAEYAAFKQAMDTAAKSTEKVGDAAKRAGGQVDDSVRRQETAVGRLAQSAEKNRESWDRAGTALSAFGLVTTAAVGMTVKAAMDWESAWTGVLKTVDGTPAQLQAVEDGLRAMARELPATHQEIAAVAEAAGQLGISTGGIVDFTRTMVNLGETTNLTAQDAAMALARFSNVMGTSEGDIGRLGSTVVGLGNNFATTEAEIVAMATRLSSAGAVAGFTEAQVLGLATAMSSIGIEAEAGGTAMSQTIATISKAVIEGGQDLEGFAQLAGMTSQDFAAAWKSDPIVALDGVIGGLDRMNKSGGNTYQVLEDLGISGIRQTAMLQGLATATGIATDAVGLANEEWEKNTALVEEAAKRYDTTEARLQIAKNTITDAAITVGESFLPVLAQGAEAVGAFAEAFASLPQPVQGALGGITALVGATSLLAGGFLLTFPRMIETGRALRDIGAISPTTASRLGRVTAAAVKLGGAAIGIAAVGTAIAKIAEASYMDRIETGMGNVAKAVAEASTAADAAALDRLFVGKDGKPIIDGVSNLDEAIRRTFSPESGERFNDWAESIVNGATGIEGSSQILEGAWSRLDQQLADMVNGGSADLAATTFGILRDRMLAGGATAAEVDRTFGLYKDSLAGVDAQQQLTAGSAEGLTGGLEQVDPAAEAATQALEDWRQMVADSDQSFKDIGGAFQAVIDKQREVAEEAASSSASTKDSWEDFYDGVSVSMDDWIAEMEAQAKAQSEWRENILKITSEIREQMPADMVAATDAMVDELIAMGPEGAAALAAFADASPAERERLVSAWMGTGEDIVSEIEAARNPVIDIEANSELAAVQLSYLLEAIDTAEGTITIEGDMGPARQALSAVTAAVDSASGTVTIFGDDGQALTTLSDYTATVDKSGGTVTIRGNDSQGRSTVVTLTNWVDRQGASVNVGANTGPARADGAALVAHLNSLRATVGVSAETSAAQMAVNGFINRNSGRRIVIGTSHVTAEATGGRLARFASGGRFPGIPPADPMADNLLGVDQRGMPRVLVRSREWVINEQSSDYYGDGVLAAINARRIPKEVLLGGLASGGSVARGIATPASSGPAFPTSLSATVGPGALAEAFDGVALTLMTDAGPIRAIAHAEAAGVVAGARRASDATRSTRGRRG